MDLTHLRRCFLAYTSAPRPTPDDVVSASPVSVACKASINDFGFFCNRQNAQTLQRLFVHSAILYIPYYKGRYCYFFNNLYLVRSRDEIDGKGPKNGFCVLWYLLWVKAQNAVQGFAGLFPAIVSRFAPSFQKVRNGILTKKLSIQLNLQILEIKTTKCCYSPYFHMTQNFLYDITLITTILKIVTIKFSF